MEINVCGFDPSMSNWGVVHAKLNVVTNQVTIMGMHICRTESESKKNVIKQSDDLRRAKILHAEVLLVAQNKAIVFSEIPFCNPGTYASANFNAGLVTGVLAACPVPLIQVFPQEIKMMACGSRSATKDEMIEWAVKLHPEAPWLRRTFKGKQVLTKDNEHLADALGAIYSGIRSEQFKQAISMLRAVSA